jgi:hypothetical protein
MRESAELSRQVVERFGWERIFGGFWTHVMSAMAS